MPNISKGHILLQYNHLDKGMIIIYQRVTDRPGETDKRMERRTEWAWGGKTDRQTYRQTKNERGDRRKEGRKKCIETENREMLWYQLCGHQAVITKISGATSDKNVGIITTVSLVEQNGQNSYLYSAEYESRVLIFARVQYHSHQAHCYCPAVVCILTTTSTHYCLI